MYQHFLTIAHVFSKKVMIKNWVYNRALVEKYKMQPWLIGVIIGLIVMHCTLTSKPWKEPKNQKKLEGPLGLVYTQSVLIRNGPIRSTSDILGFLKKWLVEL